MVAAVMVSVQDKPTGLRDARAAIEATMSTAAGETLPCDPAHCSESNNDTSIGVGACLLLTGSELPLPELGRSQGLG
jgi:hypothetical protein